MFHHFWEFYRVCASTDEDLQNPFSQADREEMLSLSRLPHALYGTVTETIFPPTESVTLQRCITAQKPICDSGLSRKDLPRCGQVQERQEHRDLILKTTSGKNTWHMLHKNSAYLYLDR